MGARGQRQRRQAAASARTPVPWCVMSIVVDIALKPVNELDWIVDSEKKTGKSEQGSKLITEPLAERKHGLIAVTLNLLTITSYTNSG